MAQPRKHKAALVAAAAKLFRRHGYAATGLSEILAESGAPRGSLYYYFPGGKEEIAAAAVDTAGKLVNDTLETLANDTSSAAEFLDKYTDMLAGWMAASKFKDGCPIATTILETVPQSEAITEVGQRVFAGWRSIIAGVLHRDGMSMEEAQPLADYIMATVEGAMLMARVQQDIQPFKNAAANFKRLSAG